MDIPALTLDQLLFGGVLPTFVRVLFAATLHACVTCPLCEAFMGDFGSVPPCGEQPRCIPFRNLPLPPRGQRGVVIAFPLQAAVLPALRRLSTARNWYRIGRQTPVHPAFGLLQVRPTPRDGL